MVASGGLWCPGLQVTVALTGAGRVLFLGLTRLLLSRKMQPQILSTCLNWLSPKERSGQAWMGCPRCDAGESAGELAECSSWLEVGQAGTIE